MEDVSITQQSVNENSIETLSNSHTNIINVLYILFQV